MPYVLLDALLIVLLQAAFESSVDERHLAYRAGTVMLGVSLLGTTIFANQVYLKKTLEFDSTLSVMTRVIARAEAVPAFKPGETPVALVGSIEDSELSVVHEGFEKLDALDAARPVVTSSFRLPQGDYFLSEVWRYGRDRLENALKNIFENGDPKMAFVLLIINPHHMRLLAAPREEMSKEEAYDRMMAHLASCQANLEQYFELTLTIKRVVPYDNLYALSRENAARTAH